MICHYYWYITMTALLLRAGICVPMSLFEHHLACDLVYLFLGMEGWGPTVFHGIPLSNQMHQKLKKALKKLEIRNFLPLAREND